MSRGSNEAGDSSEFVYPPLKKPKENPVPEAEAKAKVDAKVDVRMRILRKGDWDDPEYKRQRDIFEEQFESSEGYDVDWDNLDFNFPAVRFEWASGLSARHTNIELLNLLIETAIDEENEETGTKLEFVKYVSANVLGVQGFLFYITFWAKDLSSPVPEPKLYQAKVRKFADEIDVSEFRLRPTQE
ncbi:unnamed protein product [Arabidopsis lyrata]|uniref:Cystatin domain-containing protein n=1 Tax=Arabidopsis lyrata subsp. lyrata TaxID=81972 RepID=D7MAE5_ARALL|nr:uncharacterized protein LOC9304264 [Arabidopsis lyrata subsp. lyrata]XP_020874950.1 uncharacterized protein LOC9304264 [Arabidopsis lyrata subsp. lyrata]XP_020874951.1 uncharacterized protein LOC9304264 [Arabidopsis lyrata subsp. lyrata]EFH46475.1 hypothetical protein ARALYDRAFT_915224 [Arabidopsis lyrata subsp. lyrata]CAH8276523.1 unnamed protein product [Arabidopsis lyrata]|eukprot:XP_002870216.1 uncharacterized protein LOC9304264 [Arabidopsis lyrata subsp. lyrata]